MTYESDPVALAGRVAREVKTGSRNGVTTRIAVARRTYPTGRDDLWDAVTNPERIPRWFLPVSGTLEVGGRYQFEGNAGGVVEACEAPSSFAVTWEYGDQVSWLTVSLFPDADGTILELVHEAVVNPDLWAQFGPGAVGLGWDLGLLGLGEHIRTGHAVDPAVGIGYPLTSEGRSFVGAAAAGWASAAAADGDDHAAASEAAERSVAFYTTMPVE